MRANPGGMIGPDDVVGRDRLIQDLWDILDTQSVVLTSERRICKTTVIRTMVERPSRGDVVCFFADIEGLNTPGEFVEAVYRQAEPFLSTGNRAAMKFQRLLQKIGGAQIGDVRLPQLSQHWKDLLCALMEDICSIDSRAVLFFWDEIPLFLHKVAGALGEPAAMEFLDCMRALRQTHKSLRMLFTGSVGLHLIVQGLRNAGYANRPTNDMRLVEVPPLSPQDGSLLATRLIEGERIPCQEDCGAVAARISEVAGHVPYYIHYLVARLKATDAVATTEEVDRHVRLLISDPHDPADFRYFRHRLDTYYPAPEVEMALAILDTLAGEQALLPFGKLANLVRHRVRVEGDELIRRVARLLLEDHYLVRSGSEGAYGFRHRIVREWWKYERQ